MEINDFCLLALLLSVLYIASQIPISLSEVVDIDFSYMEFVFNATELPLEETYDYIVIGGGTTGCPLATTLSEKYKILVLERGGTPSQYPSVMSLDGFGTSLLEADDKDSPAEEFVSEDGIKFARGRILGGTSMVNAAFYSRAEKEFYAEYGIDFDLDLVMDAYKWVEDTIVSKPKLKIWQVAVRGALVEIGIGPDNGYTLDHIEGTKTGGSTFDNAGRRHGSVELLNKANRENIVVGVHAMVEKIIFSSTNSSSSGLTAVGAMYKDSEGRLHKALIRETGEVILSAGTLGSPQLLLLSGIGPKSYLSSLNIPIVYDNPYVGQYMQDMPRNDIHVQQPFSAAPSVAQVVGIRTNSTYIEALSAALPLYFPTKSGTYSPTSVLSTVDVGSILLKSAKVYSTGFLRLASSINVSANPIVRFNYFQVPADLQNCAAKVRTAAELFKTEAMDIFRFQDFNGTRYFKFLGDPLPSNLYDETAMESYCRTTLATFWHYHGGCLVGKVVDENLKVEGVDALRVVDFSTFAGSPGTNPQATLLMLGRYIGVKIIQEREKNGRSISSG